MISGGMENTMPTPDQPLKIGTRGSPLALAQAHETRDRLCKAHSLTEDCFEIVVIRTTGDRVQDRPLKEIGGKGLFTKEIEEALLAGRIDIAVHSMKDMPVVQPEGLILSTYLPREDVRDAFVSLKYDALSALPPGAVVGTSSLRRRAQLINRRPDLQVVEFRGNVQTRLRKLEEGVADATFLAVAGLNRLGMGNLAQSAIDPGEMLPAVAQGAIGIEQRAGDARSEAMLSAIHDDGTATRLAAERAFLERMEGSCETPLAALAILQGSHLRLRAEILRPDGSQIISAEEAGAATDARAIGLASADRIRRDAPPGFFDWL